MNSYGPLARWYDEAPTPQGLAGFIAARHTADLLASVQGPITRASVLAACRRRSASSGGGYAVRYQGRELAAGLVTKAMLTASEVPSDAAAAASTAAAPARQTDMAPRN